MGLVKQYWIEQQELQPMYEWIEENYGVLDPDENEQEWEEAVNEYNEYLDQIQAQEAYEHAAEEYDYYIHLTLREADERFSSDYSLLLELVKNNRNNADLLLNKMCYAHAVTLFEVYMEDITKSLIVRDDGFLMSFLRNSNAIASKKYSLKDFLVNKDALEKELDIQELRTNAISALSNILYHDIDKVVNALESMVDRDFEFDKTGLKRVVHIRHDIVHRNGINKDGVAHAIDQSAVLEAMATLKSGAEKLRSIIGHLPY